MSEETVTFNLEVNVEQALSNLRQIEGLVFRTLGYIQRLGLPENINQAITIFQRATMAIRLLHSAIIAMQVASGPIGWWRLGLSLMGMGLTFSSLTSDLGYDVQRGT